MIDRYGYDGGNFVSPKGTLYTKRALPKGSNTKPYTIFEVMEPVEVQSGKIASWFGEKGLKNSKVCQINRQALANIHIWDFLKEHVK